MSSSRMTHSPGEFKRPPHGKPAIFQVETIIHATHFHNAVVMITWCEPWYGEYAECEVELKPNAEGKIYFNCPPGRKWPAKSSRYGNVVFEFKLQNVLVTYEMLMGGQCRFIKQGTTKYWQEFSHVVLVGRAGISELPDLPITTFHPNDPMYRDSAGNWWQSDINELESMEFAFEMGVRSMKLRGKMMFYSHGVICVPLTRELNPYDLNPSSVMPSGPPIAQPTSPYHASDYRTVCMVDQSGRNWDNDQRANETEAPLEFSAAVLYFQKAHLYPFIMRFLPDMVKSLLESFGDPNAAIGPGFPTRSINFVFRSDRDSPKHFFRFEIYKHCERNFGQVKLWKDNLINECLGQFASNSTEMLEVTARVLFEGHVAFYPFIRKSGILPSLLNEMLLYSQASNISYDNNISYVFKLYQSYQSNSLAVPLCIENLTTPIDEAVLEFTAQVIVENLFKMFPLISEFNCLEKLVNKMLSYNQVFTANPLRAVPWSYTCKCCEICRELLDPQFWLQALTRLHRGEFANLVEAALKINEEFQAEQLI